MLDILINNFITKTKRVILQGAKFATVGLISVCVDYAVYISLTRLTDYFSTHYVQANMISFCFADLRAPSTESRNINHLPTSW